MRSPRSVEKVRELAATGEYETMTAIAAVVGITCERVRQIIRQYAIPWQDYHARLEWECPGCGSWISVDRSRWEHTWNHMPAHCRACHLEDRSKFCKRGHLREDHHNARGACSACLRLRGRCIAEVRVCKGCGGSLSISRGVRDQIKHGHGVGRYHRRCWIRNLSDHWWAVEASSEQRAERTAKARVGMRRKWAGLTSEQRIAWGAKVGEGLRRRWAILTPEQRAAWSAKAEVGRARWWAGRTPEERAAHGVRVWAGRRAARERRQP